MVSRISNFNLLSILPVCPIEKSANLDGDLNLARERNNPKNRDNAIEHMRANTARDVVQGGDIESWARSMHVRIQLANQIK
jgi:hypothetical protein